MTKVEEIQEAIAGLSELERLRLFSWIHTQEEDLGEDPETLREAKWGARQLDAGQGVTLEAARDLVRSLPARFARPGNK